jgi:hypothetical protein
MRKECAMKTKGTFALLLAPIRQLSNPTGLATECRWGRHLHHGLRQNSLKEGTPPTNNDHEDVQH